MLCQSASKQILNLGFSRSLFPHIWGSMCMFGCTKTLYICIKSVHTRQAYAYTEFVCTLKLFSMRKKIIVRNQKVKKKNPFMF